MVHFFSFLFMRSYLEAQHPQNHRVGVMLMNQSKNLRNLQEDPGSNYATYATHATYRMRWDLVPWPIFDGKNQKFQPGRFERSPKSNGF